MKKDWQKLVGARACPLHLFFSLLFLANCFFAVSAQSKIVLSVAAETTVEKDRIELGDIVQLDKNTANFERLKNVSLGYAPQPGATREILKERIELSIAAAGFAPSEIELNCPSKILIRRAAQQLDASLLRDALEKAVLTRFAAENVAARIVKFDAPENLQLPQGSVTVRADVSTVRNFFQPFAALFEISVDGHVARRISANVQVEATAQVLVAAHDLSLNSKVTESDVRAENRRLEKPLENYLRDASKLRGMMMLKNLSVGTELTTDAITAGIAVKNGDTVRVIGQSGKLQISISGEARASGRIGDRITVKNPTSNVILQAIIVDEGLVKVSF